MKIIITGAAGQLGTELQHTAPSEFEVAALTREHLDIIDNAQIDDAIVMHKPNIIINTAAYVKVDIAEDEPEAAFKLNAIAVRNLALRCQEKGIILLHVSTDYVFDGAKEPEPYLECDRPNPLSTYGVSKLAGELYALNLCKNIYVVRTAGLYGSRGSAGKGGNFVLAILKKAKTKEPITVIDDIIASPTYARDCASAIWQILKAQMPFGIYHAANSGSCSWHEFAKHIVTKAGLDAEIKSTKQALYPSKARRASWSVLGTSSNIKMRHWKEAVDEYLDKQGALK
ncbi:MAG: dTDP-4-dehydrorhamnose reductase [Nitrospirae bacterium]|nr:dTDP-4-dehydrorhamnose reductase [Nitrospirota bacterium]